MGFPRHNNDKGMRWIEGSEDVSTVAEDTGTERAERIRARLEVWNPISLAWDRMTQPGSSAGGGGAVTVADGADVAQGTTTDTSAANTVVGILKAIKAAVQGTLTVATHAVTQSGTWTVARSWNLVNTTDSVNVGNFPATQAVSIATNTPDVTDRSARLLGHVTVDSAPTTAITAAFLPLPNGAATSAGQSKILAANGVASATDQAAVVQQSPQRADAATLCVTATSGSGAAVTLTLPAPASGLFHYISLIEIQLYATAARTGGASPVLVSTTNLAGNPVWDFDTGQAIGTTIKQTTQPATPIKSFTAATATTIIAPIATTGIWRINVYYYTAP